MASLFTDKFFDSPLYKALQAPYNDRMARERAANNPLAPSQGGSWPDTRPRSTALTPQSYTPNIPPANPNDPNRATADMRVPGMTGPPTGGMPPFPLAYPGGKPPIDITVPTAGAPQYALNPLAASIPLPRPRPGIDIQPWLPENMVESAYAPQPAPSPAAAAINGLSPLTASERINQPIPGQPAPYNSPRDMSRQQMYEATNAAAAEAARTRDRSGFGTDGYVRNAAGDVIGRDGKYAGMTPSQMYDAINGNVPSARIDGNPDNSTFSGSDKKYLRPGDGQYIHRDPSTGKQTIRAIPAGYEVYHPRGAGSSALRQVGSGGGGSIGGSGPVTAGPMQAPRTGGSIGGAGAPRTGGAMQPPKYTLAGAMVGRRGR